MNALQKFFQDGYNEQVKTAGDTITIINPKTKEQTTTLGVLTETSGETTVEIGEVVFVVSAHLLIQEKLRVGQIVKW